jgi:hypothetical protein
MGIKIDTEKNQNQKSKPKMEQQKDIILDEIIKLGYDPKCLPKNDGKPGVKSKVRDFLSSNSLFKGSKIFDRAWDDLRKAKRIANVK